MKLNHFSILQLKPTSKQSLILLLLDSQLAAQQYLDLIWLQKIVKEFTKDFTIIH